MDNSKIDPREILFVAIIACFIFIILRWLYVKKMNCENYSPFRDTGGIFSKYTGYNYLDDYEHQQYYENNPWIYPTPTNYYRKLYSNERKNRKYLEEQRQNMLKNLKNVP